MLVLASSPRTTSRLGASMISLSAPPASIGKRTAPPPTVKLVTRSGALAARKSAAAVPTSGPTTWGAPRPHSSIRRARNSPEVSGAISPGRPSECPNPGRSMATTRPTAAMRGQMRRKGQRGAGERIVQAAAELVAEKGAAGMSLDDVRARTGASRSQLYHYFEDRDDLVHAVIDVTADSVLDRQGELLDHLDSWAGIDRWFDTLVQDQIDRQARGGCPIGCLAGQLAETDPDARATIAAGLERYEAHLRDGLTRMKARGKLRKD